MTRVEVYRIAIRAINQKLGTVKRQKVRVGLIAAREFLGRDPALRSEREIISSVWRGVYGNAGAPDMPESLWVKPND